MISVGGISSGKWVTNSFSGALRTETGSLTTRVAGMDPLEQVGRRDVVEVERRVLAHQDDVEGAQIEHLGRAEAWQWLPRSRRTSSGRARALTRPWS